MNLERLLARFVRYVQVDTTADARSSTYPSSPGQLVLGRLLADELRAIGLADAQQSEHGIVTATLPATVRHAAPTIAFCAHVDTEPSTSGKNVKPQVWRSYDGGDLRLPGDPTRVVRPSECPALAQFKGQTIITSDGTTLLGSDDKSGVAVIMEAIEWLTEHSKVPHGPVKVCFTCDEEIGHGVDHVDVAALGATVCYTLDGAGANEIDNETFSADQATVTFRGVNIHPSIAKGKMVSALRAAGMFVDLLPRDQLAPEVTDGRQGFLHPYDLRAGVAEAELLILLRDFQTPALTDQAALLRKTAAEAQAQFPGLAIDVKIIEQYRNMADGLVAEPRAVALAVEAHRRLGREARLTIVRGGTDGSRLTELGLPTPNLSCGEHQIHSPLEWTCLEEMGQAAEVVIELCKVWSEQT
ncbi:MAG: peptidase T [Planctomycetes bacterium]|nr:peptidase T [Planctomycetota bacterium]